MSFGNHSLDMYLKYFFIFTIFGLHPFRYKNKEVSFSWLLFLVSLGVWSAILCYGLFVMPVEAYDLSNPIAVRILYIFIILCSQLLSILSLVQISWSKTVYSTIIIGLFDLESFTHFTVSSWAHIIIFCWVLIFGIIDVASYMSASSIFYAFLPIQTLMAISQFTSLLQVLESQLHNLTRILENINIKSNKIKSILENHDNILNCSSELNKLFGPQLLLYLFIFFFTFVCTTFNVAYSIHNNNFELILMTVMWTISSLASTFFLVARCNSITGKNEQFLLVLRAQAKKRDSHDPNLVSMKIHLSTSQPLKVTACGFFDIDNTLLLSMGSTLTTYIMILTQLSS